MNFSLAEVSSASRAVDSNASLDRGVDPRIGRTARDFESTFLSLLMKEMRQTLDPDGGLFPGDAGDVQGGMFDLFLSQHLADAGGFGLAAVIEHQLNPPSHGAENQQRTPGLDGSSE